MDPQRVLRDTMAAPATGRNSGSQKCWAGEYTHRRCCILGDISCWAGGFTREDCCRTGGQNQSVAWWVGGPVVRSWAHFVLWYFGTRASCVSSITLSLDYCCGAGDGSLLGLTCWDKRFPRAKCCGHFIPSVSHRGDPSCWASGFSFERCCEGPGDGACWDAHHTSARCCGYDRPLFESGGDAGAVNLSALGVASRHGRCDAADGAARCEKLWRTSLQITEQLPSRAARDDAVYLAQRWRSVNSLGGMARESPAFAVSIALCGALALVDEWAGRSAFPAGLWEEVTEFVSVYRDSLTSIADADLKSLRISALDAALQERVNGHYHKALQIVLTERIEDLDQVSPDFGERVNHSFLDAFRELVEVLLELGIDFVPVQGTLISLLRYGSFPAGRLSEGKQDVVDNDAEVMVLVPGEGDLQTVGPRISLGLEARGWPPCTNPHWRKYVCFSLRHSVPCKIEIYTFMMDAAQRLIYAGRICAMPSQCEYASSFPFQQWDGRMPMDVIYPMGSCRVGGLGSWWRTPCPNKPIEFLRGWNRCEYMRQSVVPFSSGKVETSATIVPTSCLALPVISKDRDMGDRRNRDLASIGLNTEDLRLIHGYSRALHSQGYASFYRHLREEPCWLRRRSILAGNRHAGLLMSAPAAAKMTPG